MDSSYPTIKFDSKGICNRCSFFNTIFFENSKVDLNILVDKIKKTKRRSKYDCVLEFNGGVESCFTAFLLKNEGLNPLLLHINNGWNTYVSERNLEIVKNALNLDFEEYIYDLSEFFELQKAFLRSNILDIDLPSNSGIQAVLYEAAKEYGIKYVVSVENFSNTILKTNLNGYNTMKDTKLYNYILKKFSRVKLNSTPTFGLLKEFKYKFIYRIKTVYPLRTFNYNREEASHILIREFNLRDQGESHFESLYTGFWQTYLLPKKWNIDYRKELYSSLICKKLMSRDNALELLKHPLFDKYKIEIEKKEICKKLNISPSEFNSIIDAKGLFYSDFPNNKKLINFISYLYKFIFKEN
jgi:hypothetical protein